MSANLPDNILTKMSAVDRRKLGVQTGEEAQAAFVAKSERELQNVIAQYLRLKGLWFYQSRMDKATSTAKGCPDFILNVRGRFVAWEVKHGKGKLRPEQERVRDMILAQLGEWRLITSLGQAMEHLHEIYDRPELLTPNRPES